MKDPYCSSCHDLISEGEAYDIPTAEGGWRNLCPSCWHDSRINGDASMTCDTCAGALDEDNFVGDEAEFGRYHPWCRDPQRWDEASKDWLMSLPLNERVDAVTKPVRTEA